MPDRTESAARILTWATAVVFGVTIFAWSAWRWSTYRYGTFDLAFYVQALCQALRGEWQVSLLDVPLMGNHAEPIVFLALPLFALCQHPMLLVGLQTLALATLPLTGFRICRNLGLEEKPSFMLAAALALFPATGFVGLHEFHPEALAAPFLLLAIEARLRGWLGRFWLWWICALATKENIALLLVVWAIVNLWTDRKKGAVVQRQWNVFPGLLAVGWIVIYGRFIAPALNGGKVDYLELYSHLGRSGPELVRVFFTQPQRVLAALGQSITRGDLVWGTLLPFVALPLLRPRWLLIASPILFQHLLSWRASEWSIRFHYAAPLIPLLWIATVQALAGVRWRVAGGWLVLVACAAAQLWHGPARDLPTEIAEGSRHAWERKWKDELVASIQANPTGSVTASQPYLSHLATRPDLHSLHHILKGLQTLSRRQYEPPAATDFVLIDAADGSTFNAAAGYYHPTMHTADDRIIPSSERLLHDFLAPAEWKVTAVNSVCVMERTQGRGPSENQPPASGDAATMAGHQVSVADGGSALQVDTQWQLALPRTEFRWLGLIAVKGEESFEIERGLIAPEAVAATAQDRWVVRVPPGIAPGDYRVRLVVRDRLRATYERASVGPGITQIVSAGTFHLRSATD